MKHKDDYDRFNPATYMVIDRIAGEEVDVKIFVEQASIKGWQKAYAKILAAYINVAGDKSSQLLAYLIENKTSENLVHGTQDEIAAGSGVSVAVAKRVFKKLLDGKFLKKVRSGCYMITPRMMRVGSDYQGAVLFQLWDDIGNK